jgi:glucose-1-phosphate cytidylyltransferase
MKAVILAGGLGTRISEETHLRPKPMVEIGGRPILWHVMKIYSSFGINDFVICAGYKSYVIKEFFSNYFLHCSDVTFDLSKGSYEISAQRSEPWRVTVVDTGEHSMTGGRIGRIKKYVNETFCMTYGDGLANINLAEQIAFHKAHKKSATVTAVQPPGRFGALEMNDSGHVSRFLEKPQGDGAWINGGFFVLEPSIFDLIPNDECIWEREPMETLAKTGQLAGYKHRGFWQAMDTLRDKNQLESLWAKEQAPWKVWK